MNKEIVFVAPDQSLYERAVKIVRKYDFPAEVLFGNVQGMEELMKELGRICPEVVICRGGTCQELRPLLKIPIVEIHVSAYDILRACDEIHQTEGPVGFIGYDNVIWGVDILERILKQPVYVVNLKGGESIQELRRHIKSLADKGTAYFVGDYISSNTAREMGYRCKTVETDEQTILQTFSEAIHLLEIKKQEQAISAKYRIIANEIEDSVILLDAGEPIFNKSAELFCAKYAVDKNELLEVINTHSNNDNVISLAEDCAIALKVSPLNTVGKYPGKMLSFREVSQIQKMEQKIRVQLSKKGLSAKYSFRDICYKSECMAQTVRTAQKFAPSDATVLIQADTGTGKELFAQSIHNASHRAAKPFVAINCAALPENLLESELFGYESGAFTGANKNGRTGLFELAHQGSIFLDEIGDMALNLQARLLRVIQEKEVMRIGGEKIIPVDVRVIASTNLDLEEKVNLGTFRRDLYYRLNVLTLTIPQLNLRRDDIPLLAERILKEVACSYKKNIAGWTPAAIEALHAHDYKGNVRELRGIIECAVILCEGEYIACEDLFLNKTTRVFPGGKVGQVQQAMMLQALADNNNDYEKAAKELGIHKSTLYRKIKPAAKHSQPNLS
ncbi:MAG: sigma 54-interacting transcriptional regulator [Sporomusaceae bacterium]|nr:sigma 54-interacting transcriptional regulator [Sporomusaceae bacterium]